MRRFRFRLQSVLEYAEQVEEQRRLELAALQEKRRVAAQRLAALVISRAAVRRELIASPGKVLEIDKVEMVRAHLERLAEEIAQQREEIARLDHEHSAKTAEVIEAMRRRKILQKLREREEREHYLTLSRMEEKMLEDLVTPRHAARAR